MYLRQVFFSLKSIVSIRLRSINKSISRTLSHNSKIEFEISEVKRSSGKQSDGESDVKLIIETEAREKAEWERLTILEKIVKKILSSQINSIAILVVAGVGYIIYEQFKNDHEIKYTFINGSCPNFKFKLEQLLERKALLDPLTNIVTPVPEKFVSSYYIVLGEHGAGKSTLIRQAARKAGRGVIYVDVPSNVDKFGFAFARAIRYNFKENIRLSTWIESKMFDAPPDDGIEASWERVLLTFEKYAFDFKTKYGLVPVLIVDNCDLLASKNPQILETLQEMAKRAIDDSIWITVFVASIGITPEQMEGRSSFTRASSFFLISDLTEEEAMIYLIEKRSLSRDTAKDLYSLFGGRIKSLQNAASKIESGTAFSKIRELSLQDISRRVEKIKCRSNKREQAFLFNVLCSLTHQSEITVDELIRMETDPTIRQTMLNQLSNETLLIRSVTNGSYTYHSHVIEVCIKEYYKGQCQ